jgi:hypothetical protein
MTERKSDSDRFADINRVINAASVMIDWSGFDPEKTWVAEAETAVSSIKRRIDNANEMAAKQVRFRLASDKEADDTLNRAEAAEAALAAARAEVARLQADRAFLLLLTVGMIGATAVPTEPDVVRRAYDVLKAQAPRALPDIAVEDHIRAMLEQVAAEAEPAPAGVVADG